MGGINTLSITFVLRLNIFFEGVLRHEHGDTIVPSVHSFFLTQIDLLDIRRRFDSFGEEVFETIVDLSVVFVAL